MPQLFLNNFQTQFIASVKAAPDSASPALELDYGVLRVSDGAAGLLLNPGPGNWYVLTAFKRSGSAESEYEVLHVTAVDNAVLGECRLTVLRGQEGTTPKSYVAGDIVELRLTAGGMGQYVQTTDARMSNSRAPTGAAGGVLSGTYPNPGFAQAMATAADLGGKVDKVAGKGLSANDYTNADMAKLAGVAEQATKNATDAALRDRASHTGAQAIGTVTGLQTALDAKAPSAHTHAAATTATDGFMSANDKAKLDGVAASATSNATDDALRARASHTGTQAISTIDGLSSALGQKVDAVAGKGLSSADFTAAEKAKLGGIAASATANASDAELRARASHTGTQAISTVEGLAAALAGKQPNLVSGTNIKTINGQDITGPGNIVVAASVDAVRRPSNASPAVGEQVTLDVPILTGSAFLSLYGIGKGASQFQVSAMADFSIVLDDSGEIPGTSLSYTVAGGKLQVNSAYYWRLRYKDVDGAWSEWSAPTSFTTAAVFNTYIPTPAATPTSFGDPFEGGFYIGMIWNELQQSTTSVTIATGSKVFAVPNMTGAPIVYAGQQLEVRSRANPENKMIGTVSAASGTTFVVNVSSISGSGTFTDWSIMARFRVITAPRASGQTNTRIKNADTAIPVACQTLTEGRRATLAMYAAGTATEYPAAHWSQGLSIGGYTDWYLPARDEHELFWRNLKPSADNNSALDRSNSPSYNYRNLGAYEDISIVNGTNKNSFPQGAGYTPTVPGQTAVTAFRSGGAEAVNGNTGTSSWHSATYVWITSWGQVGWQGISTFSTVVAFRAVRRSII